MSTEPRYSWEDFEQDESTDVIPGKLILTITDEGEEMAVIVHRTMTGLNDERMMDAKRERAQRIVDALNCTADLEVLATAASHWAAELTDYVIDGSREAGDTESAEAQEAERDAIQAALGRYAEQKESAA